MFDKSSITQAVNSIYSVLKYRIKNDYCIKDDNDVDYITNELLKIHGMDKDRFSIIDQIETLLVNKLNDSSIDDNSNKNEKTIKGIIKESTTPIDKIVGYRFLYRKMVELFGKKEAKYLSSLMYDYTLALADSVSILTPYCWAFDASVLVTEGKPFGQLHSMKVKRLDSYTSLLNEIVHQMSNHVAGAIAIGSFFIDIARLLMVEEHKSISDLKDKEYRKYIKNQFQKVIHGFNSLSRNGVESPFTNISLFDRIKLRKIIEEKKDYFKPLKEIKLYLEETLNINYMDYVIEFIIELQNIYMEFFDEGDPSNEGMMYRFPISTVNLSKKKNKEGKWIVEDKKFLKSACKKDIYRYNIFVSEGQKVASCCFDKNQKILFRDQKNNIYIKSFEELYNMPLLTKITSEIFSKGYWEKGDIVKIQRNDRKMYKVITKNNKELIMTEDHINACYRGDKFTKDLTLYDFLEGYEKINLKELEKNAYIYHNSLVYLGIKSIELLEDYNEEYVYCFEMSNKYDPYFTLANGITTHNCRLWSEQDKIDLASQANSFGAGGSLSLGSHRVITINYARLALMSSSIDDFETLIRHHVTNCKKILFAHKELLKEMGKDQVFIQHGWMTLNRMFSTIGVIGYVEADEVLKNKLNKKFDYKEFMLQTLNDELFKNNENYKDLIFNVEQIPGEAMSHRLAKADKILFDHNYKIYANQFVPLWSNSCSVWEKMEQDGKYLSYLTGGGISHINTCEHVTSTQAEKLVNYAIECNLEHFALTGTFCQCVDGHVHIGNTDKCVKCGKDIVQKMARTVGFFTPVEDWSIPKQEYDFKRRKEFECKDFN